MGKDELHLKRRKGRQERKEAIELQRPDKWLIVCEGSKTEPNYFKSAINHINQKLPKDHQLNVTIKGEGKNTTSLVTTTLELQTIIDKYILKTRPYGKIFVVFDKDSFQDSEFNNAVAMCEANGFIPLWSNQAFEYWLLLHFNKYDMKIKRQDYQKLLNKAFKNEYTYKKNDASIYDKVCKYGSLNNAIKYAKQIHNQHQSNNNSPAKSESCTTVYRFFDETNNRIDEIKR